MASAQPTGLRIRDKMDKTKKIVMILFIVLALAQSFLIFKGGYYDNTDSGLANFITPLHQQYTGYATGFYGGAYTPTATTFPINLLAGIQEVLFIAGPVIGATLFYGIVFYITAISMYYLLDILTEASLTKNRYKIVISVMGAILYTFWFFPTYGPSHNLTAAFLPLAILSLVMLAVIKKKGAPLILVTLLTAGSIGLLLAIGDMAEMIPNLIILGITTVMLTATTKDKKEYIQALILVSVLVIIQLAPMIIAAIQYMPMLSTALQANNYHADLNSAFIYTHYNEQSIQSALQLDGNRISSEPLGMYADNALPALTAQSFIAMLAIMSVYFLIGEKDKYKRAIVMAMQLSLLVFVAFYVVPPIAYSPILLLLAREAEPIFYYLIFFTMAVLATYSAYRLEETIKTTNGKIALLMVMGGILLIHLYYLNIIELQNATSFQIPSYAIQTAAYLNAMPQGDYGIAILPAQSPFGYYTTYYYGTNIYAYMLNESVWTGGYTAPSGVLLPTQEMLGYATWAERIGNTTITNSTEIANGMRAFGIRYIILEQDAVSEPNYTQFNMSLLERNLQSAKGLKEIKTFNKTIIYEVS